jgi:hypothetical protein
MTSLPIPEEDCLMLMNILFDIPDQRRISAELIDLFHVGK